MNSFLGDEMKDLERIGRQSLKMRPRSASSSIVNSFLGDEMKDLERIGHLVLEDEAEKCEQQHSELFYVVV